MAFFSDLVRRPDPRCLSVLRRGNMAGVRKDLEHCVGSTFEVSVPQGSIGVVFCGVGSDVVVEGFTQASPLRRTGEVFVGDRLVAVCGEDVRSRGMTYAIGKIVASQHMAGRALRFERGNGVVGPGIISSGGGGGGGGGGADGLVNPAPSAAIRTPAAGARTGGFADADAAAPRFDVTWNVVEELPVKQLRYRLQAFEGLDLGGVGDEDLPRVYNQIVEETASRADVGKPRPFVPHRLTKPIPASDESVAFLPDMFDFVNRYVEALPAGKALNPKHLRTQCAAKVAALSGGRAGGGNSFESKHWRAWFDEAISDVQEMLSVWDWMAEELRLFKFRRSVPPRVVQMAPNFLGSGDPKDDWTHQFNGSVHSAVRQISYRRVKLARSAPIYVRSAALSKKMRQPVWFMISEV
jgi:hypothetical protein